MAQSGPEMARHSHPRRLKCLVGHLQHGGGHHLVVRPMHQQDRRQFERCRLMELSDKLPPLTEHKVAELRAFWQCQAALGYRLPAQPDLIVLDGGRR